MNNLDEYQKKESPIEAEDVEVIDRSNFSEYFFDARRFGPKEGQIMAKFTAVAYFGEGLEKRDLIKVLMKDKAEEAAQVMQRLHLAKPPDHFRVCREIVEDLLSGMPIWEVAQKDYEYILEVYYYVERKYVPKNDSHWETIDLLEYDKDTNTFHSKIEG